MLFVSLGSLCRMFVESERKAWVSILIAGSLREEMKWFAGYWLSFRQNSRLFPEAGGCRDMQVCWWDLCVLRSVSDVRWQVCKQGQNMNEKHFPLQSTEDVIPVMIIPLRHNQPISSYQCRAVIYLNRPEHYL